MLKTKKSSEERIEEALIRENNKLINKFIQLSKIIDNDRVFTCDGKGTPMYWYIWEENNKGQLINRLFEGISADLNKYLKEKLEITSNIIFKP
jgi:hypothetical protein